MQGIRVGQYEFTRQLGQGAFGEVWLARDHKLGRDVAIKRLKADVVGNADVRRRFDSEADTLLQLNEPHVVRVFDRIEIEGAPALVTEYMECGSLVDQSESRDDKFEVEELLRWCEQAALGLAAVHRRGILHRDIKPANLFLSHDQNLSIGDFGLARDLDTTQSLGLHGTVPFMSPEQIRGQEIDARSDLFSLGVSFYELATGERPFGDALDRKRRSGPASSLRPEIPPQFSDILDDLIEPDREKRIQTADDLVARLREMGSGQPRRSPAGLSQSSRRRLLASAAVLVVVVAAVLLGRKILSEAPLHECDLEPKRSRRVVVLPFEYHGDEKLERLGTEIPELLASRLDGMNGFVVAAPTSYANCWVESEGPVAEIATIHEWMEDHHTRLVVSGVITEISGRLRMDLDFRYHDPDGQTRNDESSITLDDAADVLPAVNDVGLEILRNLLREPGDDLAREALAAGTTLEAMIAFLDEYWAMIHLQLSYPDFGKAASLDSSMAMAHYNVSTVAYWTDSGVESVRAPLVKAARHRDQLSPYGRHLVDSALHEVDTEMDQAEALLVKAISSFPDRTFAILRLANFHYQHNASRGHTMLESTREFELVLEMQPRNKFPWQYLQWLWFMAGDDETIRGMMQDQPSPERETMFAFTFGTQAERDSLLEVIDFCPSALTGVGLLVLSYRDNHHNILELLEASVCPDMAPEFLAWAALTLAHVNAGVGRWQAAYRWFEEVPEAFRPFRLEYESLALSLPFNPFDETRIREQIRQLEEWRPLREPSRVDPQLEYLFRLRYHPHLSLHEHLRLYCLAVLKIRLGEFAEARSYLGRLDEMAVGEEFRKFIEDLGTIGEARIRYAEGDPAGTLDQLEKVHRYRYTSGGYSAFFQRADSRYLRGLCLAELGRHREAIGWFDAADEGVELLKIYTSFGHLGQARSLEALDRLEEAADHYRIFLRLMEGCDPVYQAEVEAASERLSILEPQS